MLFSMLSIFLRVSFFFFNDTATTEIYTLSLHDALPISNESLCGFALTSKASTFALARSRSEEHTSELQSRSDLVCRLLLEKKKKLEDAPFHGQNDSNGQGNEQSGSFPVICLLFFFNDTATTEIYTLSLHDALPI